MWSYQLELCQSVRLSDLAKLNVSGSKELSKKSSRNPETSGHSGSGIIAKILPGSRKYAKIIPESGIFEDFRTGKCCKILDPGIRYPGQQVLLTSE